MFWEDICNDLADPNNRDLLKKYYSVWEQIFSNQEKSISSEQVASIHCLLSLEIQQDCNLLQELLNQNQDALSKKWQSCFSKNRDVWREESFRLLLARSSIELMSKLQKFYHQLDDIESRCKSLAALRSRIKLLDSKPIVEDSKGGLWGFNTNPLHPLASGYYTYSDLKEEFDLTERSSTDFNKLKEKVHETLNFGNQITCELIKLCNSRS